MDRVRYTPCSVTSCHMVSIVSKKGLTASPWDEPTVEQTLWRTKFEELIQTCVSYVMENNKKLGISVRRSEMEGPKGCASPLKYNVVDDGDEQVRTDSSPFMYPKVKSRRLKDQEVWQVRFVDSETREDLHPETLTRKRLDILRCVLVVDNIFIGSQCKSVQVFVKEAMVKVHEQVSFLDMESLAS